MQNNPFILICSDTKEASTDEVCLWLNHLNKPFLRISCHDRIIIHKIILDSNQMDIEFGFSTLEGKFYLSQISSYWYRRSYLKFELMKKVGFEFETVEVGEQLTDELVKEYDAVKTYFELKINELAKLNIFQNNDINKLHALDTARKLGLNIPASMVAKNKEDFISLNTKNGLITKSIGDFRFELNDKSYYVMTNQIQMEDIEPTTFFYSLVQEQVPKKYELRIFYAFDQFYSTAIFSQENDKTKIDFRNYDWENPNTVVPYKLPNEIELKLRSLMDSLGLKSGSIDMAYCGHNYYVFFEVNPVGQFEQVSLPANYDLFKIIAQNL